ncbi:MAG TPA: ATP-grasp domain-containing protein, partial [Isosphaeraceae bacterium]|nr:ATP-grasp domain-containing protein [Isosphaeraceae bacterium]
SALRGGYKPICADFFADKDLAAACPARRIDLRHSSRHFAAVAESCSPSHWLYAGGFENRPELVDRIARKHRLLGMDGETLRAIRDPIRVARVLGQAGIPCPAVTLSARGLPRDGSWLKKRLNSGGGQGIEPLIDAAPARLGCRYLQQRVKGPSYSALYIGAPRGASLVGVTRQLIGAPGSPFGYRGSIGPLATSAPLTARLKALGSVLSSAFGLTGWFGVDYILNRGIPWPVEINPRYTASVEVHELFLGRSLLSDHRRACEGIDEDTDSSAISGETSRPVFGKLIIYAPRGVVVPECLRLRAQARDLFAVNSIADVPWPGTSIGVGEPLMTLLSNAATLEACRKRLFRLEQKWLRRLGIAADKPALGASSG